MIAPSAYIRSKKHLPKSPLTSVLISASLLPSLAMFASPSTLADVEPIEVAKIDVVDVIGYRPETFKADKVSSAKFTQPLLDTPQTIVVVKKELFEQQSATTLSEALRNTPGITLLMGENGNTATGDSIFMRGFDTQGSIFVDGIRDLGTISRDTFNTEQVEIAKGPAGVDNGRGAAAGYVNLSSKKAQKNDIYSANFTHGDGDYNRASIDVNKSFDEENAAARINLMKQQSGITGRDIVENNLAGVATSIAFGLAADTHFYFNVLHNKQQNLPDGGVPTFGLTGYYSSTLTAAFPNNNIPELMPVNSENFYGSKNDFNDVSATMGSIFIEHDFNQHASLRNSTRIGRSSQLMELTGVNGLIVKDKTDMNTWELQRMRQGKDQANEILTNQTNLRMDFTVAGFKHEMASGIEFIYESQITQNCVVPWVTPTSTLHLVQKNANLFHPSVGDFFQPLIKDGTQIDGKTTTAAIYALDTITLNPQWELSVGMRTENYVTQTNQIVRQSEVNPQVVPIGTLLGRSANASDQLFSWKIGSVYKPISNASVYISYATSQLPPGSSNFTAQGAFALNTDNSVINANSPNIDPQKGTNKEIGTKWDLFNNKLSFTAAAFKSTNENELVTNTDTSVTPVGAREVSGVELGLSGIIQKNWQINMGLAFMDPKIIQGSSGAGSTLTNLNGGAIQWSPKRSFTLWNNYDFANGFSLGGGARYMDSVVSSSITDPSKLAVRSLVNVPEYWVLDAMAAYQFNAQTKLQINLFNLANEKYLVSVNNAGTRYYPGAPRSIRVGLNLNF